MKYVPAVDVRFDQIEAGLQEVLRRCPDTWTPRDVYRRLKEGRAFLILGDHGFFVWEKCYDPHSFEQFLNIWAMWFEPGKGQESEDQLYEAIEQLRKEINAEWVQFTSPRKAWRAGAARKGKFMEHATIWRWYV